METSPLYLIQLNASNVLPDHGGIATYTHELAFRCSHKGAVVHLLTYPPRTGRRTKAAYTVHESRSFDLRALIRRGGSRADLLTRLPLKVAAMTWKTLQTIKTLPRDHEGQILWAINWWPEGITAYLAAWICNVPYVVTAHGYEAFVPCDAKRHFLYERVMNRAKRVFAVSNHTADMLVRCGVSEDRIRVIRNGVDTEKFRAPSRSDPAPAWGTSIPTMSGKTFLLVTVSRLVPRKGHAAILKAMKELEPRIPGLRYVAAGDGPLRESLERQVRELGLGEKVCFMGAISEEEKVALLQTCDVFVMPNRDIVGPSGALDTEGLGIVFLEAAACEKPTIGGRAGGVPEVVHHGKTGFLVDPLDPLDLERAIHTLWREGEMRQTMGRAGRDRVRKEFSWDMVCERYLKEIRDIVTSKETLRNGV